MSPDFEKPFVVQTDTSGVGLGAILLQEVDEDRRPVAYIIKKLFLREQQYSTVEECFGIKWAVDSRTSFMVALKGAICTHVSQSRGRGNQSSILCRCCVL